MNLSIRFVEACKVRIDGRPAPEPVLMVHFAEIPESMPLEQQALEMRIQAQGLLLHADMLDFQRTGKALHRQCAEQAKRAMYALIALRTPERQAEMERVQGGAPHA